MCEYLVANGFCRLGFAVVKLPAPGSFGIELGAGVRDIKGPASAGLLCRDALRLTPAGRDLLACVFLNDSRGW